MSLSLRGALAWSFAERYTSLVVTMASTMVLARLLTPAQVGIFSLCASVTIVAGILRDFGVSEYLIQEKELSRAKLKAAFGIAIAVAWSIGAVVFLTRGFVANYFGEPGVEKVLAVLSLNFLILPFASPAAALLNREMAFRKMFAIQTISNAVQSLTAVGLAFNGYGYMSLAWAPVLSIAVQTMLVSYFRPRDSFMWPSLKHARGVLSYGTMFVSSRVAETLTRNAHEFMIAKQFGFTSVGLFSRAFGLIELFYSNVTSAILRVASPAFADNHRAGVGSTEAFSRGTAIITCIAWPFFGFIALMAFEIIHLLFGPQWDAAAPIATVLALSIMPTYLYVLGPNLLAATGHVRRRLMISFFYCPVHLGAVFFASFHGLEAIAAAFGLSNLVQLGLYWWQLPKVLGTRSMALLSPSFTSGIVSLCCIAAEALTAYVCGEQHVSGFVTLLLVAATGTIAWLLSVYATKHAILVEIKQLLHRRPT